MKDFDIVKLQTYFRGATTIINCLPSQEQAGREVRVIVKPDATSDEDARTVAHKIAKEIEETQSYPGTVKVTVIRELRVEEEAK